MKVIVDNRVRLPEAARLSREVFGALRDEFTHENTHREALRRMGVPHWGEPSVIRTYVIDKATGAIDFPRGGLTRVLLLLQNHGIDVEVSDDRAPGIDVELPKSMRELYPHQREIVRAGLEWEQCLFRAPQAAGKTSALIALAAETGLSTLVVVHSNALADQWRKRLVADLGLRPKQIGAVGGGKLDLRPVTVGIHMSVKKAAKREEFRRYFGCVVGDEQHLIPAASYYAAIDQMPARYRFAASADTKRKDGKEFLLRDLFGEVAVDVDRNELVDTGRIVDVELRIVPTGFRAPWYGLSESSGDDRHVDMTRLVTEMAANHARNEIIVDATEGEAASGEQVLVMAHLREHVMRLGQMLSARGFAVGYLLGGKDSRAEFNRTIEGIESGRVRIGVGTYKALGTGVDLPSIGAVVAATPITSNKQFFGQVRGRAARPTAGKSSARMFVVFDPHVFPAHAKKLAGWAKTSRVLEHGRWADARQWARSRPWEADERDEYDGAQASGSSTGNGTDG